MKTYVTNFILFIFLFASAGISSAQENTVTGSVTTLNDIAVVNAEVKVLSSKVTVFTDSLGKFKVNCSLKDKIKISANGFNSQKVKVNKYTEDLSVNLKLKPKEENIDVAVGYGHIKEKDKNYAISSVRNNDKNNFSSYTDIKEVILNISPSIAYRNGGFVIRGEGSLLGSNSALIVIDGMASDMSRLSALPPSVVKSIDVLKGAAASIYGTRGANGVIIINTKKAGDID